MPWCDDCARFWNPASMGAQGQCPTCGRVLTPAATGSATAGAHKADHGAPGDEPEAAPSAPWHFKLMLVALVIYLGYRAFQGVAWLVAHL